MTDITNIYVMEMECGTYKIGKADFPRNRHSSIQSSSPFTVALMGSTQVSASVARRVEDSLRKRYQRWHMRGEWFTLPDHHTPQSFAKAVLRCAHVLGKAHAMIA